MCDLCGKTLLVDEDVRYIADICVFAAYDVMEITSFDLDRDIKAEIRKTLKNMEGRDTTELEEEVYAKRLLDLCPSCRKIFIDDPLAKGKRKQ